MTSEGSSEARTHVGRTRVLINGQHALGASDWQGGGEARGVGADGGGGGLED